MYDKKSQTQFRDRNGTIDTYGKGQEFKSSVKALEILGSEKIDLENV